MRQLTHSILLELKILVKEKGNTNNPIYPCLKLARGSEKVILKPENQYECLQYSGHKRNPMSQTVMSNQAITKSTTKMDNCDPVDIVYLLHSVILSRILNCVLYF